MEVHKLSLPLPSTSLTPSSVSNVCSLPDNLEDLEDLIKRAVIDENKEACEALYEHLVKNPGEENIKDHYDLIAKQLMLRYTLLVNKEDFVNPCIPAYIPFADKNGYTMDPNMYLRGLEHAAMTGFYPAACIHDQLLEKQIKRSSYGMIFRNLVIHSGKNAENFKPEYRPSFTQNTNKPDFIPKGQ